MTIEEMGELRATLHDGVSMMNHGAIWSHQSWAEMFEIRSLAAGKCDLEQLAE